MKPIVCDHVLELFDPFSARAIRLRARATQSAAGLLQGLLEKAQTGRFRGADFVKWCGEKGDRGASKEDSD
jgi:hypothetical protein